MEELEQKILNLLKEELGEYSHFEVKEQINWNTLENKAEFIKDVQSLCNSLSPEPIRYLVVGYNKNNKTFKDVSNYQEFDDGKLVSLFSAYFDPEITFKSHAFVIEDNKHFIVIEYPKDKLTPPYLIKKEMKEQGKEAYLNLGEIWIKGGGKGGSSSKRRATRNDLYEMFDLYIEQLTEKRTQIRVSEAMKTKQISTLAHELISPENFDLSLIYKEDEIFLDIIKQLILGERSFYLRELVENLRQNIIGSWKKTKHDTIKPEDLETLTDLTHDAKVSQLQPAVRKLVLLGIQLIKTRSYPSTFDRLLQILAELYAYGYKPDYGIQFVQNQKYLDENLSFSLPSLESMTAFNLLGAYATKLGNSSYISKLINLKTKWEDGHESRLMMFLSASGREEYSGIAELKNSDGKSYKNLINYFVEKGNYSGKGNYLIPHVFDDDDDEENWLASFDLIKELNSQVLIHNWVAQQKIKEIEFNKLKLQLPEGTAEYKINELRRKVYGEYDYWQSPFAYFASFLNLNSDKVSPILERLITLYQQKDYSELENYFVTDKHNSLNYEQFDRFIFEAIEDIKRQRSQAYNFASFFGWFGKDVDNFLKATAKKYNLTGQI